MSDLSTTQTITAEEELPPGARDKLRQLERDEKKFKDTEIENADLKKQLAIHEAGITGLNETQKLALFASHKGEISPEELQKTASELGFWQPPAEVDPAVQKAHEQIAEASRGATTVNSSTADDEIAAAGNRKDFWEAARRHGVAS